MKKLIVLAILLSLFVAGCATTAKNAQTSAPEKIYAGENHFSIWQYSGRFYVTGNEEMNKKFVETLVLPYTNTILGAGPQGQTVVFEADTKDPAYAEGLMENFRQIPFLVESKDNNYFVYKCHGRLYVIGDPKTRDFFVKHKLLPLTKTLLGAGPGGETVVFEEAKKDSKFAENLMKRYNSKG